MLEAFHTHGIVEAGCDEAGRGCLAGPVFAAAVIMSPEVRIEGLDDSKKLTESKRKALRTKIESLAISWGVAAVEADEIDEVNILNASYIAMHRAIDKLRMKPEQLLIDGNRFRPYHDLPFHCIIGGDGKYTSIAAASILAKTYRDEHMKMLHQQFPGYGWASNKGYPTRRHREAIRQFGITRHHRKTFRLTDEQLIIDFRSGS